MIDLNKQYKTRDNREVKGLFIEGDSIYGYIKDAKFWSPIVWNLDGFYSEGGMTGLDLIEVKPMRKVFRCIWMTPQGDIEGVEETPWIDMHNRSTVTVEVGSVDTDNGSTLIAIIEAETDGKVFNVINVEK